MTSLRAVIDSEGTYYSFIDSGAVEGSSDYTTLVILHGAAFNGGSFRKLLPLLRTDHNVRLVIVNRRDYAGSSPNPSIASENDIFRLKALAVDMANLLSWIIDNLKIPPMTSQGDRGGLALLGWSVGTATTLTLLGQPDIVSREVYDAIEPYLRKLIIYDSPFISFGYPVPDGPYDPFTDPSFPSKEAVVANFGVWVSGYYEHPDFASRTLYGLDIRSKHGMRPSIFDQELLRYCEPAPAAAELLDYSSPAVQQVFRDQTRRALFDEKLAQTVLPRLNVVYGVCTMAQWFTVWGFMEIEREYTTRIRRGEMVRPMTFVHIEDSNHFVHWENPEKFLRVTLDSLRPP